MVIVSLTGFLGVENFFASHKLTREAEQRAGTDRQNKDRIETDRKTSRQRENLETLFFYSIGIRFY